MILAVNDHGRSYARFWAHLGGEVVTDPTILFKNPESVKLVCFTGGEDVSPELYGHKNLGSHCSKARDERETLIFEMAKKHRIPMTGICRGSQFLNVMCGGTMVQHLKASHGGSHHRCQTIEGKQFEVTSSHHQMVVPGPGGEVLAWAHMRLNPGNCVYDGTLPTSVLEPDEDGFVVKVTEAFAYPDQRVFGAQFHAEWMDITSEAAQWQLQKTAELCWGQEKRQRSMAEMEALF